jgi:GTP-binding protein Era
MRLSNEIPHHLSVTIEEFRDTKNILHIDACIWVEKESHKSIVIGKEGKVLKDVGTLARNDLEKFFNKNINLKTWVKIKNKWADSRTALKQFGY